MLTRSVKRALQRSISESLHTIREARPLTTLSRPAQRRTAMLARAVAQETGLPRPLVSQWFQRVWLQHIQSSRFSSSAGSDGQTASSAGAAGTADAGDDEEDRKSQKKERKRHATEEEEEEEEEEEDEGHDERQEEEEPIPWYKLVLMLGAVGIALFFGARTVMELFPTATSPNSIRNRAFRALEGSPEVSQAFGQLTVMYGANYGGNRGRRNFVPSYTYSKKGKKFTRIKVVVENEHNHRATVFVEVRHDRPEEFNYLMVQLPSKRVLNLVDNREPVMPLRVRQQMVARRLMTVSSRFYSKGPIDALSRAQEAQLGPAWADVERTHVVRCDLDEQACERDGVTKPPAWIIRGKTYQGKLNLDDLERLLFEEQK